MAIHHIRWANDVGSTALVNRHHERFQTVLVQADVADVQHEGRHVTEEHQKAGEYDHEAWRNGRKESSILRKKKIPWNFSRNKFKFSYNWIN